MTTINTVLGVFESQLGTTEYPFGTNYVKYNDWYYGRHVAGAWCATFLSWCFYMAGLPIPATTSKGFAYTPAGADWFKRNGRWTNIPNKGHVVFFDFPNDGVNRISHTGVIYAVGSGYIQTYEGNTDESGSRTGGKVMDRIRSTGIVGYGIPPYTSTPVPAPQPAPMPIVKESDPVFIGYRPDGVAWLMYSNGTKRILSGTEINNFEGKLQKVLCPELLKITPDA